VCVRVHSCLNQAFRMADSCFYLSVLYTYLLFSVRFSCLKLLLTSFFQVESIVTTYRWAPFVPVALDSSMLTVLLLLSKYRLRNVPVIEAGKPDMKNFITQSAVVQSLMQCRGSEWFDCIVSRHLADFGLPFMSDDKVIHLNCKRTYISFSSLYYSFVSKYKLEKRLNAQWSSMTF